MHRAHRVAARLRAGTVWINAYRVVAPNMPFGGFGDSGLGRENGMDAVNEYTETKSVFVELTGAPATRSSWADLRTRQRPLPGGREGALARAGQWLRLP